MQNTIQGTVQAGATSRVVGVRVVETIVNNGVPGQRQQGTSGLRWLLFNKNKMKCGMNLFIFLFTLTFHGTVRGSRGMGGGGGVNGWAKNPRYHLVGHESFV